MYASCSHQRTVFRTVDPFLAVHSCRDCGKRLHDIQRNPFCRHEEWRSRDATEEGRTYVCVCGALQVVPWTFEYSSGRERRLREVWVQNRPGHRPHLFTTQNREGMVEE